MRPIEMTYDVPYGTIHYWVSRTEPERPWIVFLPGLTADHRLFDKQVEQLGEKYNCLTWDAPAHGCSRPFELKFSMEDTTRYLYDILNKEGIIKPVLVGQSLGGYISQVYMNMFPDSVSGFISIDSCPLKRKYYTKWELALLKRTKPLYMSIPWRLLIKLGANGTSKSEYGRKIMKQTMESYNKKEYCELADHGFKIFAEAVEADKDYELKCPVLLLCGSKDAAGSAKNYNRRWKKQEGYTLIWLDGAGHNSNTDAPERVNRIIDGFMSAINAHAQPDLFV